MEFKEKLQDYTRDEFVKLIKKITEVNVSKSKHDKLIHHFDQIVKHPKGADLLFYPDPNLDSYGYDETGNIVMGIKLWHNNNGQLAFKDDTLPPPRQPPGPRLSAKDRAWNVSSANLAKVQKLSATINESKKEVEKAFSRLEMKLAAAENNFREHVKTKANKSQIPVFESELAGLGMAQHSVTLSISGYDFHELSVQFALDDAQRSVSYSHLDRELQANILQQMTQCSEQYLASRPSLRQRQQALHMRAEAVIGSIEAHLIRLASTVGAGPLKEASVFRASLNAIGALPRVLTTYSDVSHLFDAIQADLAQAIRSAIGGIAWEANATSEEQPLKYASAMSFEFDKPGCGEPFAISVPLTELAPTEGKDWQNLAQNQMEVDLPFRMGAGVTGLRSMTLSDGLKQITELAHIYIVSTSSASIASKVKVRPAIWDVESSAYRFTSPYFPENTVLWEINAQSRPVKNRSRGPGIIAPVPVPMVEEVPLGEDLYFDDSIVVFPTDAGIEPVYVTFKGPMQYPGVATGTGQITAGNWLQSGNPENGIAVPRQVADPLRGKVFKRFSLLREALWKAVADDQSLSEQFSAESVEEMKAGRAPYKSPPSPGTRRRLEIRHVVAPESGGDVYDMDNLRIIA